MKIKLPKPMEGFYHITRKPLTKAQCAKFFRRIERLRQSIGGGYKKEK